MIEVIEGIDSPKYCQYKCEENELCEFFLPLTVLRNRATSIQIQPHTPQTNIKFVTLLLVLPSLHTTKPATQKNKSKKFKCLKKIVEINS